MTGLCWTFPTRHLPQTDNHNASNRTNERRKALKTTRLVTLGILAILIWAMPGSAQLQKTPLMQTFPGWGVQAWVDELVGYPKDVVAEAFHFSPDGSFYEVQDEATIMKIAVTFDAKRAIQKHKIPIDAGGTVQVILDGIPQEFLHQDGHVYPFLSNSHSIIELDFSSGRHTLELINNSCTDRSECWGILVVGKCLWGTEKDITFVQSGLPDPQ